MKRKIPTIFSAAILSGGFLLITIVTNGQKSTLKKDPQTKSFESRKKGRDTVDRRDKYCRIQPRVATVDITHFGLMKINDIIYPGSIIDGNSIEDASYRPIVRERNPLTIYCSELPFANPTDAKVLIESPTPSNVAVGLRTMFSKPLSRGSNQPAQMDMEVRQVHSKEEISMSLNIQTAGFASASISNSFSYDEDEKTINLTVIYNQVYFAVNVDPPSAQLSYFKDSLTQIRSNWVYVNSVSYGRRGVLVLKLHSLEKTMIDSFKMKLGKVKNVNIEANAFWNRYSSNIAVNGFVYGGNPDGSTRPFEGADPKKVLQRFFDYIEAGEKYNMLSPGLPIFYELRYLDDNSAAGVHQVLEHNVRTCNRVFQYFVTLKEFRTEATNDGSDDNQEELYGQVGVLFKRGQDPSVNILAYDAAELIPYTGGLEPISSSNGNILFRRVSTQGCVLLNDVSKKSYSVDQVIVFEFNPQNEPAEIILHGDIWERDEEWNDDDEHLIRGLNESRNQIHVNVSDLDPNKPGKSKTTRELVFETVNPGSKHFAVITIEVKRL